MRIKLVEKLNNEHNPDIICLQETKAEDKHFPQQAIRDIGFNHIVFSGQKSYNGVAILSKTKLQGNGYINWCNKNDCRHISVKIKDKIELHNFYIPAGGDEPDVLTNPKFAHKIEFLNEIKSYFSADKKTQKNVDKLFPSTEIAVFYWHLLWTCDV